MNSKLKVCQGNSLPEIKNPSPEQIERALDDLIPAKDHFVILVSEEPVQNCAFIQTTICWSVDTETGYYYYVDTRFNYDGERFNQYKCHMTNTNELKKMFRMFALGVIPDVTNWTDITEEMIARRVEWRKKNNG